MSRPCCPLSLAVVAAVALCAATAAGESGGTTFDFRALSCRRAAGGGRSCQSNLVSQATKWELLACIHSKDLPKQHALRLEKERYVKGSLDQDGMRVLTDRSFESAAASAGEPPSALSGSYRTFVRLPDASGGTYRVSFSYTMLHSAGNLGGCLIWQSDGSGGRIGKLTMLKLADFEDDFIPFSRTVKVLPGAERLEVDLRIYGTGELRVKDISLAKETAQFPFETELTAMGLLDGVFATDEADATNERGKFVSVTDSRGVRHTAADMGVDVVYGPDGVRQFLTPSRLADVAVGDIYSIDLVESGLYGGRIPTKESPLKIGEKAVIRVRLANAN